MHVIAAKAVAFKEALSDDFKIYSKQIIANAKTMANEMIDMGYNLVSGGTDTHLILIDLTDLNITGKLAEKSLEIAGITVNKNMVPFDTKSPMITSGIRIGTPAITTRGMQEKEMKLIVKLIDRALKNPQNLDNLKQIRNEVINLCHNYPLYKDIN